MSGRPAGTAPAERRPQCGKSAAVFSAAAAVRACGKKSAAARPAGAAVFFALAALFSVCAPRPAFAADFSLSSSVQSAAGVCAPWTDSAGDFIGAQETLRSALDVYGQAASAFLDAKICFDALSAFSGENVMESVSGGNVLTAEIIEAWFEYRAPLSGAAELSFRAGRQIQAWGKADGVRIADVLCPQNTGVLFTSEYSESRLGIDCARVSLSAAAFSLDFWWAPLFRPSVLPLEESDPLHAALGPAAAIISADGIDVVTPEASLANGTYAARFSAYFSALDFSLYGFYGFDDTPVLYFVPSESESGKLRAEYYRLAMAGADAALPIGDFVLRGECAFFFDRAFRATAGSPIKKNQICALCGIDWIRSGWTVTAQYYEKIIPAHDDAAADDFRTNGATVSVSKSFLRETLDVSGTAAVGLIEFDSAFSAEIKYALTDELAASLGADVYFAGPSDDGEYGAYKDLSNIWVKGVFRF